MHGGCKGGTVISKTKKKPAKTEAAEKPSAVADASGEDERRKHPRYAEPCLKVAIGEDTFETVNWSMGGMMLGDYKGGLSVGSIFKITSLGKADGGMMNEVTIHGRVIRLEGQGLGFDYLEVDGRGYALLQAFMAERMALLNEDNPIF